MLLYFFFFLVGLERRVGIVVMVAVNLVHVLQRCLCLDEDLSFGGKRDVRLVLEDAQWGVSKVEPGYL